MPEGLEGVLKSSEEQFQGTGASRQMGAGGAAQTWLDLTAAPRGVLGLEAGPWVLHLSLRTLLVASGLSVSLPGPPFPHLISWLHGLGLARI